MQVWRERRSSKAFEDEYQESLRTGALIFEAEAVRRAVEGLKRFKFDKGKPIVDPETGSPYFELEYSDRLLELLLKRHFPSEYREKSAETHVTAVTNNMVVLTEDKLKELQARRAALLQGE